MDSSLHNNVSKPIEILVTYRRPLLIAVLLISAGLLYTIPGLEVEHALNLTYDPRSPSYQAYRDFVHTFGADQFVLLAVQTPNAVTDAGMLSSLGEATSQLERIEGIHDVLSLTNVRLPRTGTSR